MPSGQRRGPGWIYFIKAEEYEAIKIGFTRESVRARLQQCQTGCPEELELEAWIRGTGEMETELHARFADRHIRGDWFEDCNEIWDYIRDRMRERPDEVCGPWPDWIRQAEADMPRLLRKLEIQEAYLLRLEDARDAEFLSANPNP